MHFKPSKELFSVKTKTIALVLIIYFILSIIFFFTRYSDIKDFVSIRQQAQFQRAEFIYELALQRVKKFYLARGYANIHSFGIEDALKRKDITSLYRLSLPRWDIIKKENPYLNSFCFYDKDGDLLISFGKSPETKLSFAKNSKESYSGFWFKKDSLDYHAVAEARDKNGELIGYVLFVIDPRYFLSEIKKSIDIQTYIVYKTAIYMLQDDTNMRDIIKSGKIRELSEIMTQKGIFVPHIIQEKDLGKKDDFQLIFLQDVSHWKEIMQKAMIQSFLAMIILIFVTALIINYGFDIILKRLYESNKKLLESQTELENLNKNLQEKIEKEIGLKLKKEREANEKERILVHQSKLASMGEMIGNIAHQWRQPLTELSSILINLELYFDHNKLTKEKFKAKIEESNEQILFMSKTIEDFRNFFKSNKPREDYRISIVVENVQKLMGSTLKNNHIELKIVIQDDFSINGYVNEVSQALINIFNNAKDVISERKVQEGCIRIETFMQDDKKIMTVEDNAGGIEIIPIEKIFEPYISTKHAKSGTGIGLYMTKTIIEKNNNGIIEVQNTEKGAMFIVTFS